MDKQLMKQKKELGNVDETDRARNIKRRKRPLLTCQTKLSKASPRCQ